MIVFKGSRFSLYFFIFSPSLALTPLPPKLQYPQYHILLFFAIIDIITITIIIINDIIIITIIFELTHDRTKLQEDIQKINL